RQRRVLYCCPGDGWLSAALAGSTRCVRCVVPYTRSFFRLLKTLFCIAFTLLKSSNVRRIGWIGEDERVQLLPSLVPSFMYGFIPPSTSAGRRSVLPVFLRRRVLSVTPAVRSDQSGAFPAGAGRKPMWRHC